MRLGSWNIEISIWKSIELVKIFKKRRISIVCAHGTKWEGTKVQDVDKYKL